MTGTRSNGAVADMPQAVSEGLLTLGGVILRTYVMDDGRRLIHSEDADRLFRAMADDACAPFTPDEVKALEEFHHGGKVQ